MLVDFMIIGAQKSGTTTLANQLAAHPQICFCREKEPGYFNRHEDWQAGLDDYHSLYDPRPGQLCGEGSTMYTFLPEWPKTHERLYAYNPELKLIYIMRHPVERIISNYTHRIVRKTEQESPERAIFSHPEYINRTRYGVQIRPYVELFGRERILPLLFEEYIADPLATLKKVGEFLDIGLDEFVPIVQQRQMAHSSTGAFYLPPTAQQISEIPAVSALKNYLPSPVRESARRLFGNKLDSKPTFSSEIRQLLWRFVEDDVAAMEDIMGRRLSLWRQGYSE